jgi:ATP-dependent helicase/nuclease subunit B
LKKPVVDEESLDDRVIEEAIAEQLLMDGVFIDDPEVIAALDEGASAAKPHVIALKGRKKNEPDNSLSADLLEKLLDHTVHAAESCVRSVLAGDIRVFPIEGKERGGCEFCDYTSICRFENHRSGNRERSIDKMSWKAVKSALETEEEDEA